MPLFHLNVDDLRKWLAREGGLTPHEAKAYVSAFADDIKSLCTDLREAGDNLIEAVGGDVDRATGISETFCHAWLEFCDLVGDGADSEDDDDEDYSEEEDDTSGTDDTASDWDEASVN